MFVKRFLPIAALAALALLAPVPGQGQEKKEQTLPKGTKVERNFCEYGPHKERNVLDLYLPKSNAAESLPLIIWIHGGGWQNGSKDSGIQAIRMLTKGYAVASINYRLSQHAVYPAQIEDCKAAMRYLRANAKKYNLDPDHFGVWGSSAGGHLVALLGTTGDTKEFDGDGSNKEVSSRVQAVCDWFGPADFLTFKEQRPDGKGVDPEDTKAPLAKLFGGPLSEKKEIAAKASPVKFVSKTSAPFLILHGEKDYTVPVGQSKELHEALQKAGVDSTLIVIPDAGHGGPQFTSAENAKKTEEFFNKYLKVKK